MKKGTLHLAVAAGLLALGANSVEAETPVTAPASTLEVRVINNNASPVQVYVRDGMGKLHRMAMVASADVRIVEIPSEITGLGALQLKIVPSQPVWSYAGGGDPMYAIRTHDLDLKSGEAVNFWVEDHLPDSRVEIVKG
ncbi:MAG TPA: hypothetical protein VJ997_04315 [Longimicrobiales bacterium]|nr:hypothetical protein [Longimicrobiales bacterium]